MFPDAPTHHLRPADGLDDLRDARLQDLGRGASGHRAPDSEVVAAFQDVIQGGIVLLEEAMQSRSRGAARVVGGLARRAFHLFFAVQFPVGKSAQEEDEPAGRGVDGHRRSPLRLQFLRELAEVLSESGLGTRPSPSPVCGGERLNRRFLQ